MSISDYGYVISDEKKKLFNTLLEMLDEIERVCRKNDIRYFAFAGTLLGAVRHQGFIPWDDDIDLLMLRKDYDRFVSVCEKDLGPNYTIQTTLNEEQYYKYQTRVRKNDTTCLSSTEIEKIKAGIKIPYNCGLFISIFPLDTVPASGIMRKIQKRMAFVRNNLLKYYADNTDRSPKARIAIAYCKMVGYKNIYKRFENSFSKYSKKAGEMVQFPVLYSFAPITSYYAEDFAETVYLPFEDRMIPCPVGYKRCLSRPFGDDYMTPPPMDKRGEHSHGQYLNFEKGYQEILSLDRTAQLKMIREYMGEQ